MNCFDTEQKLGSYLERVCSEAERHEIEEHLQTCGHCAQQVKALQQIDILLKNEIFPEPAEEYWVELPKTIIHRLGLSQPLTFRNKVSQFFNALVVPQHIAWGMTGAVAVIVILLLIMHREQPNSGFSPIAEQQVMHEAAPSPGENTSLIDPPQGNSNAQRPDDVPGAVPQLLEGGKETNSKERNRKASDESSSDLAMETRSEGLRNKSFTVPLQSVAIVPVRYDKLMNPKYERVVYPVPYMIFTTTTDFVQEDDEGRRREIQTYSFDHGRQMPRTRRSDKVNDLKVQESEFYEILWIAQETNILSEKRNIWLSYLSRETHPTFRTLAIFNLAGVLSRIVEESQEIEMAREALNFYKEHEESLRVQMKRRYEEKIAFFKFLIKRE